MTLFDEIVWWIHQEAFLILRIRMTSINIQKEEKLRVCTEIIIINNNNNTKKIHSIRIQIDILYIDRLFLKIRPICLCICYWFIHRKKSIMELFLSCLSIRRKRKLRHVDSAFVLRLVDVLLDTIDQTIVKCYLSSCLSVVSTQHEYIRSTICDFVLFTPFKDRRK